MPFEGPLPLDLGAHSAHKQDRFLVILETTTKEKIIQYQAVARALGLPIQFHALSELFESFHAAEEDKHNRIDNGFQKFFEADLKSRDLYDVNSPYYRLLQEKCLEWGVKFNPARTFIAADDATFEVPSRLWKPLKKMLIPFVPKKLLRSIDKENDDKKSDWAGPGAETGPVLAAAGVTRTINLFRQAAQEACCQQTRVRVGRTLIMRSLAESMEGVRPYALSAESIMYLFAPRGLDQLIEPPDVPIAFLEHHFKASLTDKRPIGDDVINYQTKLGPIGGILRQFFALARERELAAGTDPEPDANMQARTEASQKKFKTVRPDLRSSQKKAASFEKVLDLTREFDGADVLEFLPFDASDDDARQRNYYKLFSAVVAKQTDARFMNVPIIVHDDGCWAPAIKLLYELANQGMSKDFIHTKYEGGPLIKNEHLEHIATAWLDIVRGKNHRELEKAAAQVKSIRRQFYSRFRRPPGLSFHDDLKYIEAPAGNLLTPKPDGLFTVGIFTSASNDNHKLLNTMGKFAGFVQKLGCGHAWGAGDRHAMGAVPEGALEIAKDMANLNWFAGFTTRKIAEPETIHSKPPALCHWPKKYSPTIYKRMADIIDVSDMLVVAPGGPGTVQEMLATLQLIRNFPEVMKNKPVVLYMPDIHKDNKNAETLFWENAVKHIWGNDFWEQLRSNPHKGINGIYMATHLEELKLMTRHFKGDHDARHKPAKLPRDNPGTRRQKAAAYAA
jgi:predicted Rossmann-fold nucleotide-binding protein